MTAIERLIAYLLGAAARIRELEEEGKAALYERKDEASYRRNLIEKTDILVGLAAGIHDLVSSLPAPLREETWRRLREITEDAANAKRIGSIFYMSALLYPQDYVEGEPNELEELIAFLEKVKEAIP